MPNRPRILAFAGSTRADSLNKKLVRQAALGAKNAGADVTILDLRDYPLANYDGDAEARDGVPPNAIKLKQIFLAHQGLLIASPEYNSGISGVLKNTIDWVSRPAKPDEQSLACFAGKTAAILAASPGGLGGIRGLVQLRSILSNIRVIVLPDQITIPEAHTAFNDDGTLKDAKKQASVEKLGAALVATVAKLNA